MTWRIDSGGTISGEGVETDGQALYYRDEDLMQLGHTWYFADVSSTVDTTWETLVSTYIYLPTFTRENDELHVEVEIVSAGTGGQLRLRDNSTSTTGTEVSTGTTGEMDLTLGDWGSAPRLIDIQAYKTSGTLTIGATRRLFNVWFVSAA